MDRTSYQQAYGGEFAGGEIATTVLPPPIPGYKKFDLYPAGADNKGDVDQGQGGAEKCGQPNGFATNIGVPRRAAQGEGDRRGVPAVAGQGRHQAHLKPCPKRDYFAAVRRQAAVLRGRTTSACCVNGWGADWNDGYGFLSQIIDSRDHPATGGYANCSVRIPEVDKLLDQAAASRTSPSATRSGAQIDKQVMEDAVILPGRLRQGAALRGKNLTNVFVNDGVRLVRLPGHGRQAVGPLSVRPHRRQVKAQVAGPPIRRAGHPSRQRGHATSSGA